MEKECIRHRFVRVKPSLLRCAELGAPLVPIRTLIRSCWAVHPLL